MVEHGLLGTILILLALSVAAVAVVRRLNLTPILAYLCVGVAAGPHALGWAPDGHTIGAVAEVGVVFLLFTIGLEFSIPQLLAMKGTVLGLGGAQVLLSAAGGGAIAWLFGIPWAGAVVVGGALALSSTAIVMKQLTEQLEMRSRHGRLAFGILLFQDLAVVPFLVVIPILAGGAEQHLAGPLSWALLKGAAAFFVMFAMGHWVLRPLFHTVAAAHSAELFTLTVLLVSLAAAWVTFLLGLSLALGAFLAGMMLGETEYRHQVETDIRPFRDVLMGLFFIGIGTQLDLAALPGLWRDVAILFIAAILGKGLLVAFLTRAAGYENGVALRTGMVLAQGGEFGFALLALALDWGLLSRGESQAALAAVVLSMVCAPFLIRYNGILAKWLFAGSYLRGRRAHAEEVAAAARPLEGHVIVCGFGRIGQNLAGFLTEEGFEYVGLDLDPLLIKEAWEAGERVFFGDSTHREILEAAGLERARAVVITFDDAPTSERIIHAVRERCPKIPVVVRTRDDSHLEQLEEAGATDVVPETVESSMMLATHLLQHLGVPPDEVMHLVEKARHDHYRALRGFFHGEAIEGVGEVDRYRLHTVVLPRGGYAVGKALGSLDLAAAGVSVNAVRRGAIRGAAPSTKLVLQAGDALVLQGPPEVLAHAEERLLKG